MLVFLADRPGTSYDLQQRHLQTFGSRRAVDVTRIGIVLNRQERVGYVRTAAVASPGTRRVCTLTDAGRRRQRTWMLEVPPALSEAEVIDRVLLAMTAGDRATFDTVVAACLAVLQSAPSPPDLDPAPVVSARHARAELEEIRTASVLTWLRRLGDRPRGRDIAA
ncbi:hypothetical protein [Actinoplanes sp. NPDC026670]|uniref:hypothetical protein n=1 Tax=Actinoplanes sp. NPDC026670 TaxID=3154700 RepID=UPI0033F53215